MSHRSRLIPLLVLASLAAGGLAAQDQGARGRPVPPKSTPEALRNKWRTQETPASAGILNGTFKPLEDKGERYQPGTAVPEHMREAVPGLEKFATPMVGILPQRVSPGTSGTLSVVLALRGDWVIEQGAHVVLDYRREQGPFRFGGFTLDPAQAGRQPGAYQGQAVYDDTITAFIPVTVAADAPHGKFNISLHVEADVSNGKLGGFHSRVRSDIVNGEITVGPPLPALALEVEKELPLSVRDLVDDGVGEIAVAEASGDGESPVATPAMAAATLPQDEGPEAGLPAEDLDLLPGEITPAAGEGSLGLVVIAAPIALILLVLVLAMARRR